MLRLFVDADGFIQRLDGDRSLWPHDAALPVQDVFPAFAHLFPVRSRRPGHETETLPFVDAGDGRHVHVHFARPAPDLLEITLLDASAEAALLRAVQQRKNDILLFLGSAYRSEDFDAFLARATHPLEITFDATLRSIAKAIASTQAIGTGPGFPAGASSWGTSENAEPGALKHAFAEFLDALRSEPSVAKPSSPPHTAPDLLVAEDDPVFACLMKRVLTSFCSHVIVVGNGADALEHFAHQAFDAVILDFDMPAYNGLETSQRMAALELSWGAGRHTPVLILSASPPEELEELRHASSIDAVHPKDAVWRLRELLGPHLAVRRVDPDRATEWKSPSGVR